MRLIDADALLEKECCGRISGNDVRNAPTIDAEPVRHGRWMKLAYDPAWTKCSERGCNWEWGMVENCNIAKEVLFDEAIAAGAKVQRERDAAVEDLKLWHCFSCNNKSTPYCHECSHNIVRLVRGYFSGRDHYEWRGVKKED